YPYLAVILNFSQTWALYCLVQFYSVTKEKLAPTKHLAKFLVGVAAVVHLYVFPAVAYKWGERCVRNVAVLDDYSSLGLPPHPEEIVDDMKYTVSHVMEPVERGIAKINKTFHEISENVKRHEALRRNSKDDSYLIPISLWTREFSEVQDSLVEGSVSDSGMSSAKKLNQRASATRNKLGR
ncbi:hypothetical protein UlMin_037498, partial [Ulmus minor]